MGEPALLKKAAEERIIHFDEAAVRDHLGEMVRSTVEETLNQMLETEADRLCNAEKYERTEALWGTKVSPGTISKLNKKGYRARDEGG